MELAAQQKKFEEEPASQESEVVEQDKTEVVEPGEREREGTGDKGLGDSELGVESLEWEIQDESGSNEAGFFYEEEEEQEDETIRIGARVAARR